MSDSPIIILPGGPPEAPPEDLHMRYELGAHDGTGAARYVKLGRDAKLTNYFDDVFTEVLKLAGANGGVGSLLAHGVQCLWCFTAKNVSALERRLTVITGRIDDLHQADRDQAARIRKLEADNAALRAQVNDR